MLTMHCRIVPWLRMSGAVPLLPLCTFVVWTETALPDDCNVVWNYPIEHFLTFC